MKFILFQVSLVLLFCHAAFGQGNLSGTVSNRQGEPISDVNIFIQRINLGTITDKVGRFQLKNIPAGNYDVMLSSVGYQSQQKTVTIKPNENTSLTIVLEEGELVLADVIVTDQLSVETNTISQVDIKLRPINTSQEILRIIPGLFIAQHAGGGKAEQIFLRGFDIDHGTDINLEVDGLPVNMVSHAHGQGYADLHFVIPEIVGNVDFNKGPYYADKGNFTTAGYASFQTKNSLDQNIVKIEGGRFGSLRNVNAINVLNKQVEDWRTTAYIATEYFRTDGFFESPQHFNRLNLMAKLTTYHGDKEMFTAGISTFNSRWDASGQIPTRAVEQGLITRFGSIDPTEGGETARTNAWIKYINVQPDGGVFDNQVYFSKYDFNLISNFTFYLNDPVNGDQITQSESRNICGYKGNYSIDGLLAGKNIRSEAGIGFRYDDVNDIHLYRTKSRKQFLNDVARGDIDETNLYAYVSETISLTPDLSVNAALRFDHFTFNYVDALTPEYKRQSVSKPVVSPKLNISYHVTRNVNLFVKSGLGFHSNDTRVVVAQQGHDILPYAFGLDVGSNIKLGENLIMNTALWMLDLQQEFVYVGDEGIVEPGGKTRRRGIDISFRYQPLPWLYLDTDVNVTDPTARDVAKGEDYIPLAPTFTSIGGVSCKLKGGFNASIRYRYLGDRAANEDNSVVAEGYFLLDAVLKYTLKKFEWTLVAENLLNQSWNEAQFDTESLLQGEIDPVSEIHFIPGTPFFFKTGISFLF